MMHRSMTPIAEKYQNPLSSPDIAQMLKGMTTQQLTDLYQREAANPSGGGQKLIMILGEIKKREAAAKKVQQMPDSTVAQDVISRANPQPPASAQGIGQLMAQPQPPVQEQAPVMSAASGGVVDLDIPDHMFQAKHMAGGGIVAFDEGGGVDGQMTKEQFDRLSPEQQKAMLDAIQLQNLSEDKGIETVNPEMYAIPGLRIGQWGLKGLASLGKNIYKRLTKRYPAKGPTMAGKPWILPGTPGSVASGVGKDIVRFPVDRPVTTLGGTVLGTYLFGGDDEPKSKPKMAFPDGNVPPAPTDVPKMTPEEAANAFNANSDILNRGIATQAPSKVAAPRAGSPGIPSALPAQQGEDGLLGQSEAFAKRFLGEQPEEIKYDQAKQETMDRLKEFGFDPDLIKNQKAELEESRKKLGTEKSFATNMRIIEAGLAIASGASPNAFVNLKGAIPALQGLGQDINKINELDRNIDKEKRGLAVEQNKLAQGLAGASEAKVEKSKERLDTFFKNRGTIASQIYTHLSNDRTQMAVAAMQAQTAREGHAITNAYYQGLLKDNVKDDKVHADIIKKISDIRDSKEAVEDRKIIAMKGMPGSNNPYLAAKIKTAEQNELRRAQDIEALRSQLPASMYPTQTTTTAPRTITMEQIKATARQKGLSVEQVKADALSKGLVIQ